MKGKAVLAFSGGLDTSVVVKYLQEKHGLDVVTITVDVGQGDDLKKIAAKAKKLGVVRHYNVDARSEFVNDFILPSIKANALYQKKYCLATALARPLIAQKVVEIAKKENAKALSSLAVLEKETTRCDLMLPCDQVLPYQSLLPSEISTLLAM
ncbi:Argininosuccinate synthase [Candidatus Nitrosotalea sp. TS]|nr:Argininosuccinate synthase [Candidatus Nitrosotalea sp. TS]